MAYPGLELIIDLQEEVPVFDPDRFSAGSRNQAKGHIGKIPGYYAYLFILEF